MALLFAATNDEKVNEAVAKAGLKQNTFVNSADDPGRCDFFLGSVLSRGDLKIAVQTGGAAPALAKAIRKRLETEFGPEYSQLLKLVASFRKKLQKQWPDAPKKRMAILKRLDYFALADLLRKKGFAAAEKMLF